MGRMGDEFWAAWVVVRACVSVSDAPFIRLRGDFEARSTLSDSGERDSAKAEPWGLGQKLLAPRL